MVRPPVDNSICIRCKGARLLCGKKTCPILKKSSILKSVLPFDYKKVQRDKKIFGASPPAFFVGRYGYPKVAVGPMIPIDETFIRERIQSDSNLKVGGQNAIDTSILDLSEAWFGLDLDDIMTFRTSLVRTNFKASIKDATLNPIISSQNYQKSFPSNYTSNTSGDVKTYNKSRSYPIKHVNLEPDKEIFNVGTNVDDVVRKSSLEENRLLDASRELAMSKFSVDTEVDITKLRVNLTYDVHSPPLGPSGETEKIKIVDDVKPHKKVEYVINDTDLKAEDAIFLYLYPTSLSKTSRELKNPLSKNVVTGTEIQRILSAGLIGKGKARKLVPTRWAITAVDSIISKRLIRQIKEFPEISEYYTFYNEFLDNKFIILFMPKTWSFEMMECWDANTIWTQNVPGVQNINQNTFKEPIIMEDFELEKGRKTYAFNVTGAYYAARKEVAEFLYRERKQARVIVFREVNGGYIVPLGVWVIRETIRNALYKDGNNLGFHGENIRRFDNLKDALNTIPQYFGVPLKYWLRSSNLLRITKSQKTLNRWL
ncbi:MAG: hypothetical protein ACTSU2_09560 [Promethearchaeota archaeon]